MKEVYAERAEISVKKGNYFISDVLGCKLVLSSGKEIGEITEIVSGNVDYYYLSTAEGKAVFPMLKILNPIYDIGGGTVTVNAESFTQVVMYEN